MSAPEFRVFHRNSRYTYPYTVQRKRKFLKWSWWQDVMYALFRYEDDAIAYIKTRNTVVWPKPHNEEQELLPKLIRVAEAARFYADQTQHAPECHMVQAPVDLSVPCSCGYEALMKALEEVGR